MTPVPGAIPSASWGGRDRGNFPNCSEGWATLCVTNERDYQPLLVVDECAGIGATVTAASDLVAWLEWLGAGRRRRLVSRVRGR
ncbi:MAG: hypothetical protein ACRDZ8_20275 [Acidimicrobiales bacterium]